MHTPSWQTVKPPPVQHVLRKHPRHLLSVPVLVFEVSGKGPPLAHGLTLDLSLGGIASVLCGSIEVGQTFQLELYLPNGRFRTLAIVRHVSSCRCGFEFLSPNSVFQAGLTDCIHTLAQ